MRHDLNPLRPRDEATVELKLCTARRIDWVCDRTRVINRLRGTLTAIFPVLERALELTQRQPVGTADRIPGPSDDPPHGGEPSGVVAAQP